MPFSTKTKTYDVKKKTDEQKKDKDKEKKDKDKEKKDKDKEKKSKTQVRSTKVKPQLNPHCSKCPHRPPQSLTPKDERKYQRQKNYTKLYKIT